MSADEMKQAENLLDEFERRRVTLLIDRNDRDVARFRTIREAVLFLMLGGLDDRGIPVAPGESISSERFAALGAIRDLEAALKLAGEANAALEKERDAAEARADDAHRNCADANDVARLRERAETAERERREAQLETAGARAGSAALIAQIRGVLGVGPEVNILDQIRAALHSDLGGKCPACESPEKWGEFGHAPWCKRGTS